MSDDLERRVAPSCLKLTVKVKNLDGTTTTRTANGVKTTRPPNRRLPGLDKVAATVPEASGVTGGEEISSPIDRSASAPPAPPAFISNIYCSAKCAEQDAGASGFAAYETMARVFGLGITTHSDAILVPGHIGMVASPPSPLLGSDTDTSSATSASLAAITGSPASAPKNFDFFRMTRDEEAWKDINRQRRSSLANGSRFSVAPFEPLVPVARSYQQMSRQRSSTSSGRPQSSSGASSDSLASLWQNEDGNRPPSSGGAVRAMTPMGGISSTARRSMSTSSEGAGPAPTLPRGLSHTSLGGLPSPSRGLVPEAGSAPGQAAFLIHSYASAFPARDGSPMLRSATGLPIPDSRSASVSNAPNTSTIRARPRTATWDSFGKAEVRERSRRSIATRTDSSTDVAGSVPRVSPSSPELDLWRERAGSIGRDATPKQSFEDGCWQIRYTSTGRSSTRNPSRSRSASREPATATVPEDSHATSTALPIPSRARVPSTTIASSNSTARSRTPQSRLLPTVNRRIGSVSALPDLVAMTAALRVGSPCAPVVCPENASPREISHSVPRAGFDWDASNHPTYELPKGVVVNPNKGLFYFKA